MARSRLAPSRAAAGWALLLALVWAVMASWAPLAAQAPAAPQPAAPTQAAPQKSPFGIAPPSATSPRPAKSADNATLLDRFSAWISDKQAEYNRTLVQAVRRFKTEHVLTAAWALAGLSFLYGVFHAAGPGHGKAIISSYVLANERTARRGVLIAFLSSAFQALSAIAIVGVMALLFRATSVQMQAAESMIERVSYGLVMLVGAWLLFVQVRALVTGQPAHAHGHGHGHGHHHAHGHGHGDSHVHAHANEPAKGRDHDHAHAAGEPCDHCDHQHLPGPDQLESGWSWTRALALSLAVGIRPCTGAILVLVFALTQGLFWAGVFATVAMALGTAITVSALAVLAVLSRDWAARLAGGKSIWMERVYAGAGLVGSGLVFGMGFILFLGSFSSARPF